MNVAPPNRIESDAHYSFYNRYKLPPTTTLTLLSIGNRLSLYRNGCGFKSRPLQDSVFLNTLSINPVLVVSLCYVDVESLYLI